MADLKLSISSMSYEKKDDIKVLNSCLSQWFSNPKILHFVSPSMRYPFKIQQWVNQSYTKQSNTLVLKLDNWIIGHLSFRTNDQTKTAKIYHLIIEPNHRRMGYGAQLISHTERLIINSKIERITINVQNNNQIAKNFYEQNGFSAVKKTKSGRIKMLKVIKRL